MLRAYVSFVALILGCSDNGDENDGRVTAPSESSAALVRLGDMHVPRALHTATTLRDGRVLLVGGGTPGSALRSAEVYDPATGASRDVSALDVARMGHSATLLANGSVLIVGGFGGGEHGARSAELFDPVTQSFGVADAPLEPHGDGHAAVPLLDGTVLVFGGDTSGVGRTPTAAAERFDPATHRFTATGSMRVPRRTFGVVRLNDGRVLVAGGTTTNKRVVASAEIYDPATGQFTETGALRVARHKHAGVVLADGRVLIVGGTTGGDDANVLMDAEVYDPTTSRFTVAAPLLAARFKFAAARLTNDAIVAVGGSDRLVEIRRWPGTIAETVRGAEGSLRLFPAIATLADGSVLITGGYSSGGSRATVWRLRP